MIVTGASPRKTQKGFLTVPALKFIQIIIVIVIVRSK